ncbi:hypothetical protein Vretimale_15396 [Volvox reticuliferus]|uniref:Uncharacterized protein n=1 Tax=Volvox reticuliferus TaxID=1737510 RepID=A0A8J4GP04_9CHLO|nr:hypothetical protein Vretifemale_16411 [Volvox reticuliferus]GIM11953.1 hypothetical protein Vretimale_15396 [Volvox reticuliferus]
MDATPLSGRPTRQGVYLTLTEHIALNRIREIVHDCCDNVVYRSALELGRVLAGKHLFVTVRTSLPHGLHSLRHQYLLVQTQVGGAAIVVDLEFRHCFYYNGLPGGTYAACVAALPQLFVGTMASITAIVSVMSDALEREACKKGHDVPPWRSRRALFANWLPEHFTDDVYPPPSAALHPVLLHTCHTQPAFQPVALNIAEDGLYPAVAASPLCASPVTAPSKGVTAAAEAAAGVSAAGLSATGVEVGDGAGVAADEDPGGSLDEPHGLSKRKAEGAADIGSPLKSRRPTQSYHLPIVALHQHQEHQQEQAQTLRTRALKRADSSDAPSQGAYGVPLRVITGFSVPSSLATSTTSTTVTDLSSEAPIGSCSDSSSSNGGQYEGSSGKVGGVVDVNSGYAACESSVYDTDPWVTHDSHIRRRDSIDSGDSGDTACSISKGNCVAESANGGRRAASHVINASQHPWTHGSTITSAVTAAAATPPAAASGASRARSWSRRCGQDHGSAVAAKTGQTRISVQSGSASGDASQPPPLGEVAFRVGLGLVPDKKLTPAPGLESSPDGDALVSSAAFRTSAWPSQGAACGQISSIGLACAARVATTVNPAPIITAVVPAAETVAMALAEQKVLLLAASRKFTAGVVMLAAPPPSAASPAANTPAAAAAAPLPPSSELIRLAPSPSGLCLWLLTF